MIKRLWVAPIRKTGRQMEKILQGLREKSQAATQGIELAGAA
jgi:hypothetical protein